MSAVTPRVGIVVVGYNRPASLARALASLARANYPDAEIPLWISLDYSGDQRVSAVARGFEWHQGEKMVIERAERLGLKQHVLSCGDLLTSEDLDALVVLEDDLIVAPGFFGYAQMAGATYAGEPRVAGISLYSLALDQGSWGPFVPLPSPYGAYFMSIAQSWGQVWLRDQWADFRAWLHRWDGQLRRCDLLPDPMVSWPESSWLKYHTAYCAMEGKYFVYPYTSYTSNFTEVGQHNGIQLTYMHRPFALDAPGDLKLPSLDDARAVKYDVFMVNEALASALALRREECVVDFYGARHPYSARYVLTSRRLPYRVLRSFGLQLRPVELNVMLGVSGNDLFLYDRSVAAGRPRTRLTAASLWRYRYAALGGPPVRACIQIGVERVIGGVRARLRQR